MSLRILRPIELNTSGLLAALSTRVGGPPDSPFGMNLSFNVGDDPANVRSNRDAFLKAIRIKEEELAIPRQVHSATVLRADNPGPYPECDGLVTDKPRVFLSVSTADCIPLLIFEKEKRIVAAIHSGWRGTVAAIAVQGVKKMVEEYGADPHSMSAYIGPAASICCYEVSSEVASQFDPRFVRKLDGKQRVDLKGTVLNQLLSVGIPPASIDVSPLCTISEPALFHSFRRDGARSGRMMSVIGLIR
jgi:polyphenol oxidase